MSSAIALVVLPLLLQSVQATFPPVSNAPPIPNQGERPLDYQNFYFPEDLPPNQPSNVIKDEGYFQAEDKIDPKLLAPESQVGETGGFGNSDDTFDRYYSEDQPYIGPVATPLPDDTYVAQGSVTSKVLPEALPNVGSSDIWVLTKGPDNQFIRERWVQVSMPQERVVEVVNAEPQPKQYTESVKSFPPVLQPPPIPAVPVKAPLVAPVKAPPSVVQQVWIRAPSQVQSPKVYQNPPTVVEEIPSVKQVVDVPPPTIKQYIQQPPQIIQEAQPLSPTVKQYIQQPPKIIQEAQPLPVPAVKQYIQQPPQIIQEAQPVPVPAVKQYIQQPPQIIQETQPVPPPTVKQYVQQPPQIIKEVQPLPPPAVKQYVQQPQIIKEAKPLPPPPPPTAVYKKSSGFIVPPPPPPPLRVSEFVSPKQTVVVNQPPPVEQVVVEKSPPIPQLKHIWIPTSQNTGKFITIPAGSVINSGKSVPAKGVPLEASAPIAGPAAPIAVSDTWVLKQDGPIPRFEQQKSIGPVPPVIQKGSVIVESGPRVQFESPKNPPLIGKSIDTAVPVDAWPAKNPIPQQKVLISPPPPPPAPVVLPSPPVKSNTFIVGKSAPIAPPPKGVITSAKGIPQFPPPPPVVAPLQQLINGKPCPIPVVSPKSAFPQKSIPVPIPAPAYRTVAINKQPFSRILRINRYPYGPHYVLNPRTGARFYTYPRAPIAPVIQQTKNGQVVRFLSARQLAVPVAPRPVAVPVVGKQVAVPAPRKPIVVPVSNGKSAAPVLLYPPANRIRYTYPYGGYIRSLPVGGKNIFVLPPNKPLKIKEEKSSSSESSSSESSSSESKSSEKKSKLKEEKKIVKEEKKLIEKEEEVAESIESIESQELEPELEPEIEIEPEPEPEVVEEEVVAAASEAEPEETLAPIEEEPEIIDESIAVEESQVKPQLINRIYKENANSYDALTKPFYYGFEHRGLSGRKETSNPEAKKVIGSYNYRNPDGIFKNVAYVIDANGSRAQVVSNDPGTASYQTVNANYIPSAIPENTTRNVSDIETAASHENLTEDPQRD